MIEVEIKVQITDTQKLQLLTDAKFLHEEVIHDEYYDAIDYQLTTKGYWLRKRNGSFVLKTPATPDGVYNITKNMPFYELTDEPSILKALNLPLINPIEQAVKTAGYLPLYKLKNIRQKYIKNSISIDLDFVDYGDMTYSMCELEIMVEQQNQTQDALKRLYEFAQEHNIPKQTVEGKLFYYIKRKNPEHYQALMASKLSK